MLVEAALKFQKAFNLSSTESDAIAYQSSRKEVKSAYVSSGEKAFLEKVNNSQLEENTVSKLLKKVDEWKKKQDLENGTEPLPENLFTRFQRTFKASESNEKMKATRDAKKELKKAVKQSNGDFASFESELKEAGVEGKALKKVKYLFQKNFSST